MRLGNRPQEPPLPRGTWFDSHRVTRASLLQQVHLGLHQPSAFCCQSRKLTKKPAVREEAKSKVQTAQDKVWIFEATKSF